MDLKRGGSVHDGRLACTWPAGDDKDLREQSQSDGGDLCARNKPAFCSIRRTVSDQTNAKRCWQEWGLWSIQSKRLEENCRLECGSQIEAFALALTKNRQQLVPDGH